jgi:predicted outer membrane repeat protein
MRARPVLLLLLLAACNGDEPVGTDLDQDGFPAPADCDDDDPAVNPGATERCNGIDDDCDGLIDQEAVDDKEWYRDVDGDTWGDEDTAIRACDPPAEGYVDRGEDCNDLFDDVFPGGTEVCDGLDNDCDGDVDEDAQDAPEWFRDGDEDGVGTDADTVFACAPPDGYVATPGDCDDADPARGPLRDERCNGIDDDCDEAVDEADAVDPVTLWPDADMDGHGDPAGATRTGCPSLPGWADVDDDCDDTEPRVHPGRDEICDGLDNDCDPTTSEDGLVALDGVAVADPASGLSSAADGSTLAICAGAWTLSATLDMDLRIEGPGGAAATTLTPAAAGSPMFTLSDGASLTLVDLTFTDGDAPYGSVVDAREGGDVTVQACTMDGNRADQDGGAVHGSALGAVTLVDTTLTFNEAGGDGGAVWASTLQVERSTLSDNRADRGGAVLLDGGDAILDADTVFFGNTATTDGGAVAVVGPHLLEFGTYDENLARADGGAVWLGPGATFLDGIVRRNRAVGAGGGVWAEAGSSLETLTLTGNVAGRGAGVASGGGTVSLSACVIDGNEADDEGGGVAVGGGDVTISGGQIRENEAATGGGVWLGAGTLDVDGVDLGASGVDNTPDDVVVDGGSAYDTYGAGATFTCSASAGTCTP